MKRIFLFLGGCISVIVVMWWADFYEIINNIKLLDQRAFFISCILQCITILLINSQWYAMAFQMGIKTSFAKIFHINMTGTFVESITPSVKAGGEATKVFLLKSEPGFSLEKATVLVAMQKTISLLVFLALNLLSIGFLVITTGWYGLHIKIVLAGFVFLTALVFILGFVMFFPEKLGIMFAVLPKKWGKQKIKAENVLTGIKETLRKLLKQRKQLVFQLLLSCAIWVLFAFKAYYIARGLHLQISFIPIAVVTYLTYMVGMLPLLPGGIGTFEGSMIVFLIPLGVLASEAMTLALILRIVTFWLVFFISAIYLGIINIKSIFLKYNCRHI